MADFLIRVELHGATPAQYDQLHAAMFSRMTAKRFITASDGRNYLLPTAEYMTSSTKTVGAVRDDVLAIARSIKAQPDPWVLVAKTDGIAWQLKELPKT
jgi:hypothetical protein